MRVRNLSAQQIWIYLINHYGPPSFEDLVGKLQEHWDDLEGCAVGFSEACKIDALCECFDDRVFTEIVMAVRVAATTFEHAETLLSHSRELRQGLKKLLQMAMVEGEGAARTWTQNSRRTPKQ
ncbi:uncharacterized protein LOC9637993 [Selaginella moellendorffii]|uniref:uncharacterized protein LOC9637993 n=1 Tax=Selaginella moellendorffii TaxID=88036 RepID=UPI000D1CF989|nr:uncharacterized protein LOC9637993 [Selaginella moellendorffii]|eukprot:XP_024523478.1 uncharacterized protein LOC9637993 [Selaginella moellendorffii]